MPMYTASLLSEVELQIQVALSATHRGCQVARIPDMDVDDLTEENKALAIALCDQLDEQDMREWSNLLQNLARCRHELNKAQRRVDRLRKKGVE